MGDLSSRSALGSEEGPGLPSLWDPWQRQDDPCGFMGLHRSQKRVISSAGSFPVLNNGALILGFPGLSSVDFGIEGDCVRTLSQLRHLRHLFPPVSTLASPPVDWTQSAGPVLSPEALSTDTPWTGRRRRPSSTQHTLPGVRV